jgi:hypothetical protein
MVKVTPVAIEKLAPGITLTEIFAGMLRFAEIAQVPGLKRIVRLLVVPI